MSVSVCDNVSVCLCVCVSVSVCDTVVSVFYIVPNPRKYTECMPSTPVRSRDCVTASTYVTLDGGHSNTEHWELPSELFLWSNMSLGVKKLCCGFQVPGLLI